MGRLAFGVMVLSLLVLAAPAAAAQPLPTPADPTIRPPTSLAGIKLGQSFGDAQATWGAQGHCEFDTTDSLCTYGEPTSRNGSAQFFCKDGDTVSDASISAGLVNGQYSFRGPLLQIETARGNVGLGDKLSKLQHAYPQVHKVRSHEYELGGANAPMTFFVTSKKDGQRITLVKITS